MIDLDFKEHELTRCNENKKELRYAQYKKQFYLYFFLPLIVLLSSLTFIRTKQLSVLIVGFLIMYYFIKKVNDLKHQIKILKLTIYIRETEFGLRKMKQSDKELEEIKEILT